MVTVSTAMARERRPGGIRLPREQLGIGRLAHQRRGVKPIWAAVCRARWGRGTEGLVIGRLLSRGGILRMGAEESSGTQGKGLAERETSNKQPS